MPVNQNYEAVIGIEVHVQLKTKSKIFCSDATNFDAGDNENISPVSVGMPGTLPALNKEVVDLGIRTGLALNCEINPRSLFARKNYFYPDLPKGYQISQFDQPLCLNGRLEFFVDGEKKSVSITRAHLEEDAGKSTHFPQYTLLNYNRAGMPLLEVVSGPDMHSAQEAAEYCKQLRSTVRFIDACDGNLEEGSLRCDCNVSVRQKGATQLGTKVEIKNLNSFRFIEKAIEFEIERQIDQIELGQKIVQETRLYDPDKNRTVTMRIKEDAEDYRYFIDPDLLPIVVTQEKIAEIKKSLPEMPLVKQQRYQTEYGLSLNEAQVLSSEREISDLFEKLASASSNPKAAANWILSDVLRDMNEKKISLDQSLVKLNHLVDLIKAVSENKVSLKIAKNIFNEIAISGNSVESIIKDKGYSQISDEGQIKSIILEIVSQSADQVKEYQAGKTKVMAYFVGAVMKATKGQANPDLVNKLLIEALKG